MRTQILCVYCFTMVTRKLKKHRNLGKSININGISKKSQRKDFYGLKPDFKVALVSL